VRFTRSLVAFAAALALGFALVGQARADSNVTRATLSNGLQVVVVRDTLAPVVTTMMNYKVGSNEEPLDGLAHATEHMMFRGSKTISANQLTEIIGLTGGDFDADTQAEMTQYFFTVPSQYLDVALRLEASRARGLLMAQNQWNQERGAIEQEVTQDNSNAISRMLMKIQKAVYVGTPYGNNTLGTIKTFSTQINHKQLIDFYNTWYHPNNAIFVIVGNVDPHSTIAMVKKLFGSIPAAKLPARPKVAPLPLKPQVISETSDQPYTLVAQAFRFPGYDSKEYAASVIAADVLNSQRGALYGLTADGKALFTGFQSDNHPKLSGGFLFAAVAPTTKPQTIAAEMKAVIEGYKLHGVPAALVRASIRREVAQASFQYNNIANLAFAWSTALTVQGLRSPNQMIAAYRHVTTAEVNSVLRRYLVYKTSILAYAVPSNSGKISMGTGAPAKENNSIPPTKHEALPTWANEILANLKVPPQTLHPTTFSLSNGLHVIVVPSKLSKTVVLRGSIDNTPVLQEPKGQSGVGGVLATLMGYGSTTYNRIAYQAQLDKIAASVSVGTSFSLDVLSDRVARGMQLLADEELHPALPAAIFPVVRQQALGAVLGAENAPNTLAREQVQKLLYPAGDPTQRHATPASIRALTLADLQNYYQAAYRPDLTTIAIVGDISPERAKILVERYFGAWKAVGPKPQTELAAQPNNPPAAAVVPATGRVQSSTTLAQTMDFGRSNPDYAALQLANTVLTGGFYSSMLYHDLREIHGWVYYVGSQFNIEKHRSVFTISYGSNPQNIVPAQQQIVTDIEQLQQHPLGAHRLLRAKALLLGLIPVRQQSYGGVAGLLLGYAQEGLPLDENILEARQELATTPAQVQAAVAKWVRPKDFVRVVTGPGPR